ncbi:MAG TPA: hypothetical protein VK179_11590 [Bacteroidales bacterium]|nr:hypothetical protein [Bacteroidales bacterium]
MRKGISVLTVFFILLASCGKYHKGDTYTLLEGDSLIYVIGAKGHGEKLSRKVQERKVKYELKGDSCRVTYLTDSVKMNELKALMLINTTLPKMQDDMLTKGFFGTLTSKQVVSIMLVSVEDFNRYFR